MKVIKWINYQYNSIINQINFWLKKRQAERLHKLTGKRYHVIPKDKYSLIVVDNTYVDKYNKFIKNKAKKITILDLLKMSYYSTSVQGLNRK